MERTQNEIINALEVIKDTCDIYYKSGLYETCEKCPLRNAWGDCGVIEDAPKTWNINKPNEWRAF